MLLENNGVYNTCWFAKHSHEIFDSKTMQYQVMMPLVLYSRS